MLKEGEVILHEEGASHFQNYIAVGGTLILTNMRILFNTNAVAHYNHHLELSLNTVSKVEFFKTLLINPNGLAVLLKDGGIENFIVDDRKAWSNRILATLHQMAF
jgi:hypothetical protein